MWQSKKSQGKRRTHEQRRNDQGLDAKEHSRDFFSRHVHLDVSEHLSIAIRFEAISPTNKLIQPSLRDHRQEHLVDAPPLKHETPTHSTDLLESTIAQSRARNKKRR